MLIQALKTFLSLYYFLSSHVDNHITANDTTEQAPVYGYPNLESNSPLSLYLCQGSPCLIISQCLY
jgi:hypothetical protein